MPGMARVGDTVIGFGSHGAVECPHVWTGTFVQGATTVLVNAKPGVRIGDQAVTSCPHCGQAQAASGSSTVFMGGKPAHRQGDTVISPCGSGVTVAGSPNSLNTQ